MKKCNKCGRELSEENFAKDKTKKDGLRTVCKECTAETQKQYREKHKEELAQSTKEYAQAHKEEISEYRKKYAQKNKEKISE